MAQESARSTGRPALAEGAGKSSVAAARDHAGSPRLCARADRCESKGAGSQSRRGGGQPIGRQLKVMRKAIRSAITVSLMLSMPRQRYYLLLSRLH